MNTNTNSIIVDLFGNTSFSRILDFLLDKRPFEFTREEIIKETGIARNALFKAFPHFEEFGIVIFTRKIGNTKMFAWNDENEISQAILNIVLKAEKQIINKAYEMEIKKEQPISSTPLASHT